MCTNNQAGAFAITKALEYIQTTQSNEYNKSATVYTDSRMTLDSLHNPDKHTSQIEEIRLTAYELKNRGWTIRFRWIKAHAGNWGNELADRLAKEASDKTESPINLNRIPKSVIKKILEDNSVESWQKEWDTSQKGRATKEYVPEVAERLRTKIHITPQFTTMVTGHGNIKSYL
jgi:transposase-like protein